jgi:hypothetical protein
MTFFLKTVDGKPPRSPVPYRAVRGVFFHVLEATCPELAERIHQFVGPAPYATQLRVHGPTIEITVNLFDPSLTAAVKGYVLTCRDLEVRVGSTMTLLEAVAPVRIDVASILASCFPVTRFEIVFKTPTYFKVAPGIVEDEDIASKMLGVEKSSDDRVGGVPLFFPLPSAVIRNAANSWNGIVDTALAIDATRLAMWGERHVVVTSHDVRTSMESIGSGGKAVTGFTGWTRYKVLNESEEDEKYAISIDKVLRIATFANLGGNRTTGLGTIVYKPTLVVKSADSKRL